MSSVDRLHWILPEKELPVSALIPTTFTGKFLLTLLVSAVPIIELRGGIPVGTALGLGKWAIVAALIGNVLVVPFALLFLEKLFQWLRGISGWLDTIITWLEDRGMAKSETVARYQMLGLFILVAIPLPGTGAWTGCLVAVVLKLKRRRAWLPIVCGVIAAAAIVTVVTYGAVFLLS